MKPIEHQLSEAIRDVCASSIYAAGRRDYVGVEVVEFRPHDASFALTIRFVAGERYCCFESGCHTGDFGAWWWEKLRAALDGAGVKVTSPLRLRKAVFTIEQGAMSGLRGPNDDRAVRASVEQVYTVEGSTEPAS